MPNAAVALVIQIFIEWVYRKFVNQKTNLHFSCQPLKPFLKESFDMRDQP